MNVLKTSQGGFRCQRTRAVAKQTGRFRLGAHHSPYTTYFAACDVCLEADDDATAHTDSLVYGTESEDAESGYGQPPGVTKQRSKIDIKQIHDTPESFDVEVVREQKVVLGGACVASSLPGATAICGSSAAR